MGKTGKRSANGSGKNTSAKRSRTEIDSERRTTGGIGRTASEEAELGAALDGWDDAESIPDGTTDEKTGVENKTAKDVLAKINREFTRTKKESGAKEAWQYYQAAMSENMHLLSDLISVKDQMQMILEIESKMKSDSGGMEASPLEQVSKFLDDPVKVM